MYSTAQVAKKLKVGRDTLHRWIDEGLRAPDLRRIGNVKVRLWTEEDLERARAYAKKRYHRRNFAKGEKR